MVEQEHRGQPCRFGTGDWNIALVGPLPPPSGGMATQTDQLRRLLGQEGVTVELVQSNAPYRPAWAGRLKGVRALFRLIPYCLQLWRAAGRNRLFHVMANSGWSWHLFAAPAIWIAWLRGVPVIVNYRGGEAEEFFRRAMHWVRPSLRRCARIVVPSGFLEQVFISRSIEVTVVPNIIDLSRFSISPEDSRNADGRGDAPRIIVTRNLEALYDVATAIEAFASIRSRYPDATMHIAGEGEERQRLEQHCRRLGISDAVHFTGRLSHEQIAALYREADLMLNPSLADNMPNSLLEAMASGVPVVTTDVGGIPYLVEDGVHALLVPPAEPGKMAAASLAILDDAALRHRLVQAGRELVEQFTWNRIAQRWACVYGDVLGETSGEAA